MTHRILVINPNSSTKMTCSLDQALAPMRLTASAEIETMTLLEGPTAIESQLDVDRVAGTLCRRLDLEKDRADAFVIACFSDPALLVARTRVSKPVFGIGESAYLAAAAHGRFGIVSILSCVIPRHREYLRKLELESCLAGDRSVETGVSGLDDEATAIERIVAVGTELRDRDRADVLILGCAGMGRFCEVVQSRIGLIVIDPTRAAVMRALVALE